MTRDLASVASRRHDILVIGGGIHGLAVAYDAALRGLSVALVERGDFGSGSSFNHAKTVHGGLRSLQRGDVLKARFSIGERRAMARIAPHLVTPLPFVIETTRTITRSRLAMQAGFLLDAAIGLDRNAGVLPALRLPAGRLISRDACAPLFGGPRPPHVTGGAQWYDYHMADTDRLTLAFATGAARGGAALLNYAEATRPIKTGARVSGVEVRDLVSGEVVELAAQVVVNAAGSHVGRLMDALGAPHDFPLLKAMNVVTTRPAGATAVGAPTRDGRLLLVMPWRGQALVGTSHSDHLVGPDDSEVSLQELDRFLDEINSAFPERALTRSDVTLVHRGVVPAERARHGALGLRGHHQIYDHARDGVDGAISVVGVKYTTARGVGEQVVDIACRKLGRSAVCRTAITPLPGGDLISVDATMRAAIAETRGLLSESCARRLVQTHGTLWTDVVALCRATRDLAEPVTPADSTVRASVVHAARSEMALSLTDVVVRRTGLGAGRHPGHDVAAACAELMAVELGWDADRVASEQAALLRFYAPVDPTEA
jgi:glycerol-3-phosphate dehydrogenase